MKKKFAFLLCTALTLCLATACGKKDAATEGNATATPTATTEAPTDSPIADLTEEEVSPSPEAEETEEVENTENPEESTAPEDSSKPNKVVTKTATGTLNGFADSHTVEITLDNGKVYSYQISDEKVLATLEEYDMQTEPTSFRFTFTKEKNNRIITSID